MMRQNFLAKLIHLDIKNVLIVTNKFHIYRVKKIFNSFDQKVKTDFFYIDDVSDWKQTRGQ